LQRSEIEEARGYGGFPVSGIWLRCDTKSISRRHNAKVYGKAPVGSPPMSVPHLDTRIIDGKRSILFGPYAGFSTKFLKHGSYMDMFQAINPGNIQQMLSAGYDNLDLTKYLVGQVLQSSESRFGALRQFFPEAKPEDWEVQTAGQRVQTIKPNDDRRSGYLEFGTELLAASGQSLVALLGASPGASTSASIAVRVLETFFPEKMAGEWLDQVMHMMPSYKLPVDAAAACAHSRARTAEILQLESL
jgi:malate dehydrogenase (quinone)